MTTKWYDNHENLYTLAEWLREHHGWQFCKDNLIDVLEKPWKWEKEWRLASGEVEFKLVEPPREPLDEALPKSILDTDSTQCEWCDCPVGYASHVSQDGDGMEVEWIGAYMDVNSGDFACDDCAGMASNFAETVASTQAMERPTFTVVAS